MSCLWGSTWLRSLHGKKLVLTRTPCQLGIKCIMTKCIPTKHIHWRYVVSEGEMNTRCVCGKVGGCRETVMAEHWAQLQSREIKHSPRWKATRAMCLTWNLPEVLNYSCTKLSPFPLLSFWCIHVWSCPLTESGTLCFSISPVISCNNFTSAG